MLGYKSSEITIRIQCRCKRLMGECEEEEVFPIQDTCDKGPVKRGWNYFPLYENAEHGACQIKM